MPSTKPLLYPVVSLGSAKAAEVDACLSTILYLCTHHCLCPTIDQAGTLYISSVSYKSISSSQGLSAPDQGTS